MNAFDSWLHRWSLTVDGDPIATASSDLLPVRRGDVRAVLKISRIDEERRGAALMDWYGGSGAAGVIEREDSALLLERIVGCDSLITKSRSGHDDEASRIICETVARLHQPRPGNVPTELIPLTRWFQALESG